MAQPRSAEIKVGLFVVLCLTIMAGMILYFGKYQQLRRSTYEITVLFTNVSGLVKDAQVLYAGIPVGVVRHIRLDPDRPDRVNVRLGIDHDVVIRNDARFIVAQAGLLGDRHIEVTPQSLTAERLNPGDTVEGTTAMDIGEAVLRVAEVLDVTATTLKRVDQAVARMDETVFSATSLGVVTNTLANLDAASGNAAALTLGLRQTLDENRQKIDTTLDQLALTATDFRAAAQRADNLMKRGDEVLGNVDKAIADTRQDLQTASQNIAEASAKLVGIMQRLEQGEGTAGKLLVDPSLYLALRDLIQKVDQHGFFYNTWIGPRPRKLQPQPARQTDDGVVFGSDLSGAGK
jgi:phospholipid/cholesterol/gamma-HCH transport system substrate-binding protein